MPILDLRQALSHPGRRMGFINVEFQPVVNRPCRRAWPPRLQWVLGSAQGSSSAGVGCGRVPSPNLGQHNGDKEILTASKPRDKSSNHTHGS